MKKSSFLPVCALVFSLYPHLFLTAQGYVGINTVAPAYQLDIQGAIGDTNLINLYSKVNYIGNAHIKAVEGQSVPAYGYGYGGYFTGGLMGGYGEAFAGSYASSAFGLYGYATGSAGNRIGVYGTGNGGGFNYGLYGYVNGGGGNFAVYGLNPNLGGYAGYFNGRGHFTQELRADKNLIVDDTAWTSRIWNVSGNMGMRSISDIELMIDRNDNDGLAAAFEIFRGDGGHVFIVSESGNSRSLGDHYVDDDLGIGTLSPVTRLHVASGSDVGLAGLGFFQLGSTAGNNVVFDNNEILARTNGVGSDLYLQHDGGDLILCGQELGGVGIGVLSGPSIPAGYLLAVDGRIIAEELRIELSTSWPDYVFSDEYPLMPLEELKQVIRTQNHLPNIPPASVVEQEGFLVGDMQTRMMEKIEELTLYILQLHETNQQQQAEIEQLRLQLASLQK